MLERRCDQTRHGRLHVVRNEFDHVEEFAQQQLRLGGHRRHCARLGRSMDIYTEACMASVVALVEMVCTIEVRLDE